MKRFVRSLSIAASLLGFASLAPVHPQTTATVLVVAANAAPAGFQANLRSNPVPKRIQWVDARAQIS
jgi:hypothetical protein